MPYALNRYVIPLVVMSVLAAALFVVLFYFIVFPYQAVVQSNLDKDRTIQDLNNKLLAAADTNSQLTTLLGGSPEDLTKILGETSPTGGAVLHSVWDEHIKNSHVIQAEKPFANLAEYVKALETNSYSLNDQISKLNAQISQAAGEIAALQASIKSVADSVAEPNKPAPTDPKDTVTFIQNQIMQSKNTIATLNKTVADLTAQVADVQDKMAKQSAQWQPLVDSLNKKIADGDAALKTAQGQINDLQQQINVLKNQLAVYQQEKQAASSANGPLTDSYSNTPAGTIFMIDGNGLDAKGAIDIGDKQMVKLSMVFKVMHDGVIKGTVQIFRVDPNSSYFRILDIVDPTNPIVKGDVVVSPFYPGGKALSPEFVLVGDFPEPLTKEKIIDRIKEFGGTVADKISANTKYVIVGTGVIPDNVRSDIQFYSVQRITLATVKDFFGQ